MYRTEYWARSLLALALACLITGARAQGIPSDAGAFASYMADRISRQLPPGFSVKQGGPLTMNVTGPGQDTWTVDLVRPFVFCKRDAARCATATEQYAKSVGESARQRSWPIEKSMVMLALRSRRYVEVAQRQPGGGSVYTRPLAANLSVVAVIDFAGAVRLANKNDLEKLGVTEDELFRLGERNLRGKLKPLAEVAPIPSANAVGRISGEDYASSRIILHDDWKAVAEKLNQQLVVMAPLQDMLLYTEDSTPAARSALLTLGSDLTGVSLRPLPPVLLRWRESGWEEEQP